MTRIAWGALLVAVALGASACGAGDEMAAVAEPEPAAAEPEAPKELDAGQVAARLEGGEDLFLLDVRTEDEIRQDGAIEGYTHIPIDELEGRLAEVPKDKPIVAY